MDDVLDSLTISRAARPAIALRPRGRPPAHARGGRPRVRRHTRTHPPDRGQSAAQAAPPDALPQVARLLRPLNCNSGPSLRAATAIATWSKAKARACWSSAGDRCTRSRTTSKSDGVAPADLSGILLTHAHGDHCRSARCSAQRTGCPIYASNGTLGRLALHDALGRPLSAAGSSAHRRRGRRPAVRRAARLPSAARLSVRVGHRSRMYRDRSRLGARRRSTRQFRDLDLLVLEANYDPHLLENGTYPHFLKRRVASTYGHLSNAAAAEAIAACGDRAPTRRLAGPPERAEQQPQACVEHRRPHPQALRAGPRPTAHDPPPKVEPALDQQHQLPSPVGTLRPETHLR